MQQLGDDNINSAIELENAQLLLELVPVIMRRIRTEMSRRTMGGLSIPQFRALNYLSRHPKSSLNDVADHLAFTPPSASKLIQKLVIDKVVNRRGASDRRRICLSLTPTGIEALQLARAETRQQLANNLKSLSPGKLSNLSKALNDLAQVFAQGGGNVHIP
jgi:DNA-binding MarR family transcriptional regulator